MATLSDGTTTITLPDTLIWTDEYTWAPVEQTIERTVTGAVIVSVGSRTAGRPITLSGVDPDRAWIARSVLAQCRAWAAVAGQQLTLVWRGQAYTVIWRHQDGAIEAAEVAPFDDAAAADPFRTTLRLMTV